MAEPKEAPPALSPNLEDHQILLRRRTAGSDLWYGELVDYPEVNAFSLSWGGLRFELLRALDEYITLVELVNKKAEAKA